jgi:hypothetical protein
MQYCVGYRTAEGDRYIYVSVGWRELEGAELESRVRLVLAEDFGLKNPNLDIFYLARRMYA